MRRSNPSLLVMRNASASSTFASDFSPPKLPRPGLPANPPNIAWPSERQSKSAFARPLPPEIGFLTAYGISPSNLLAAAAEAIAQNISPEAVLLTNGTVNEVFFYSCLARHLGLSFIDWRVVLRRGQLFPQAIHAGLAPLRGDEGASWLAAPQGAALTALLEKGPRGERGRRDLAITTPKHLSKLIRATAILPILHEASFGLSELDKDLTALEPATRAQTLVLNMILAALCLSLALAPKLSFDLHSIGFGLIFLSSIFYRLLVGVASTLKAEPFPARPVPSGKRKQHWADKTADHELPLYSIVIALHKEARVAGQLIRALERINYPRSKLDIKLVIEKDDISTKEALEAQQLGSHFEIIVAPAGWPKTKPRALNIALPLLRGKFVTIYDAEDEPEPGQLRRAAARFSQAAESLACLQAKLAIDNVEDSWLTRLFAIEYAVLFDVLNKGTAELRLPLPLGGTSNHFRTETLREIRGWDAWNMTEDADLGIRLARFGYSVETFASTTQEEAPATLGPWLKQRRRWFKGWMQTAIVLSRDPLRLYRELGLRQSMALILTLNALIVAPLLWPFCMSLLSLKLISEGLPQPQTPIELIEATLWTSVSLLGIGSTLWLILLGMKRRKLLDLWASLPLLLPYHLIMAYAAWAALYDLIFNPFHWHKTEHGFAKTSKKRKTLKPLLAAQSASPATVSSASLTR
jgi:cellulose synthase/poly-beta-1,6-N-acetylglucosamine synthase-like glycosyltransferase